MKFSHAAGRPLLGFLAAALILAATLPSSRAAASEPPANLVRADLVSEVAEVAAGEPFWVGLRLKMHPGWHTYWQNPGDSGLATTVEWVVPEGFSAGPLLWPTPDLIKVGDLANYGYEGEVTLLTVITPPADLIPGTAIPLEVKGEWLSCDGECIPGRAKASLTLHAAADASVIDPKTAPAVADARALLPGTLASTAHLEARGEQLILQVRDPSLELARIEGALFMPDLGTVIDHGAEQPFSVDAQGLSLELTTSDLASAPPRELDGILDLRLKTDGPPMRRSFRIHAVSGDDRVLAAAGANLLQGQAQPRGAPLPEPKAAGIVGVEDVAASAAGSLGIFQVLMLALLGGIVLNLMPCVFPVLSLKVLGVAQQAGEEAKRVRLHGIAYTVGILVSFAVVAGALFALRAGGAQLGWGFQLQSPLFVAILAYVLFAMGLSLSGVLHFGGSIMGVGGSLASRPGLSGSFFTGVLATVVATPCTAPFMGAAVGYALTQPAWIGLSVFLSLGFGLALPFLLLSFVPALHRLLPRPGAWMETLKQALAFPIYGTVAWLIWVLSLQAGSIGLAAVLGGLVLIGLASWAYGASRAAGARMRRFASGLAAVAVIGSLALARMPSAADGAQAAPAWMATTAQSPQTPEPFSQERLDQLLAEGKPVFVNFTAAWCVTCLVNEKNALSTKGVRESLQEKGVTYLKGDWTNENPEITRVLEHFGRSGVPLYLVYAAGSKEPTILPQILTEATVVEHLRAL